jgi:hypothetical protein
MSKKYTVEEVAEIVQSEGLGYAVQNFLSASRIEDPELADKWRRARQLLDEIEDYLREAVGDDAYW